MAKNLPCITDTSLRSIASAGDLDRPCSRRAFLKSSLAAAGAAALAHAPVILAAPDAGRKLGVAVIGAGGMGGYSMDLGLRENLVAIVDVDENIIAQVMKDKVKDQAKPRVYDHDGLRPAIMKETEAKEQRKFGEFTLFVGDKGMIGSDAQLIPHEKHDVVPRPEKTIPRAHGGPIEDLYWCIRNSGTPASNFPDAAAPLTSIALTGHLAQFAGKGSKVEWDVDKMECTNKPEINQYVKREYRPGWEV